MRYTKKLHAYRLKTMLENREEPCNCCPASLGFSFKLESLNRFKGRIKDVCIICREFIGLIDRDYYRWKRWKLCPCLQLGKGAIEISLKALDKYYKEQNNDKK